MSFRSAPAAQPDPLYLTITDAARAVLTCVANRQPVMIHGPVGVGKSSVIEAVLAAHAVSLQVEMTSYMDATDANGIPVPDHATGSVRWYRPALVEIANAAAASQGADRPHVILHDEFNRGAMSVQNTLMRAILNNVCGTHPLASNVCHVAAVNDAADSSGVTTMSEASRNRFVHVYVKGDAAALIQWGEGNDTLTNTQHPPLTFAPTYQSLGTGNLRPEVLSYLAKRPEHAHCVERGADAFATSRSWEFVSRVLGTPSAANIERALIAGSVGVAIGREFCNHLAMYRAMVGRFDLRAIIADPHGAPLPGDDISAAYAIAHGLIANADASNFGRVLTYADRLRREFNALVVLGSVRRTPELKELACFTAWLGHHSDMV